MAIVQQASGAFTGTSFTVTLPAASSASNLVVVTVAANTTVTTPAGWALRTSQVNFMGHYLFDRAGGTNTYAFTNATGQGTWVALEVQAGVYDNATGANATSADVIYNTPALLPAAGLKMLIASIGSTTSGAIARTVTGWTNGYVEQADLCQPTADFPMQGVATQEVTADGVASTSTAVTYSSTSTGRTALIGSYVTTAGAAATPLPRRPRVVRQAVNRAGSF